MNSTRKKLSVSKNLCRLSLDLPIDLHKRVKISAAQKLLSMKSMIVDILKEHFKKGKKSCEI